MKSDKLIDGCILTVNEFKYIQKALGTGSVQVQARSRENQSFRIIAIRFEDGKPYGKRLSDSCWYPLVNAEITYDARPVR